MEVYTNKSSIELVMQAVHNTATNFVNCSTAVATATSVLPQLAEGLATAVTSNADGISLSVQEGIAVLVNGNLRLLSKLTHLAARRRGESAQQFYERCLQEEAAKEKEEKEKKAEVPSSSSIGFNKDNSF